MVGAACGSTASGIDPSLFFDDDGTVYYIAPCRRRAMGYIGQQVLNLKTGKLEGEMKEIWGGTGGMWPEGPHLFKKDGRYYLMISEGGTSYDHRVTIARSDSPWGPFEACPRNPILTHANRPDHAIQATGPRRSRGDAGGLVGGLPRDSSAGRAIHIIWDARRFSRRCRGTRDGWPTIGDRGTIELEMPAPRLPTHPWPMQAGPRRIRRRHARHSIGISSAIRTTAIGRSRERPGCLRLNGSAVTPSDRGLTGVRRPAADGPRLSGGDAT